MVSAGPLITIIVRPRIPLGNTKYLFDYQDQFLEVGVNQFKLLLYRCDQKNDVKLLIWIGRRVKRKIVRIQLIGRLPQD